MGEPGFWDDPEAAGRVGSEHARETRRVADEEKIGRNDPCWCGSGKKFKKCHGA